jgi:ribosomal protein S18 acetylase RimI-like enzyme
MHPREATARPFYLQEIPASAPNCTLAQARELLLEYGRFVIAQPGAARFCFGTLEKEAARLPFSFLEQGGGCLIAHAPADAQAQPAGFIAWRAVPATVEPDSWELKRLWVRPAARGLSLGRALTQAVLDRALAAGRKAVYLDTAPASMAAAHRMYLDLGFAPCAPYNDNPVQGLAYLRKAL